ncbi:MAG: asparagine--tRNA ligase [Ruthenibacterium lactatiformans]
MKRTEIRALFASAPADGASVTVCGWAKTVRDSKNIGFIELSDGSCFKPLQVVFEAAKLENYKDIAKAGVGTSLVVTGRVVLTPGAKQPLEVNADSIRVLGACPPEYPLQKKRHTVEFLRTMPHLRPRTNTFSAAFRVRSVAAYGIHKFLQENGFVYVHTPLITGSDCEGAGEMFRVTTLDAAQPPRTEEGAVDFSQDFFGRATNLTVSGQLEGEAMATAFGKIYTSAPPSAPRIQHTAPCGRVLMIEPGSPSRTWRMRWTSRGNGEKRHRLCSETCPDEMAFFNQFFDKTLLERLNALINSDFARVSYTEAVEILSKHNDSFQYKVEWGTDLQTEHERFLTEQIYKKPVFVTDYPKAIKSFYMRVNGDGKTVAAADMLVPGVGELCGGSQREERLDVLTARMDELGLSRADYEWYLELRRFGTVEHAGFGLGFERLIMYLTGIPNIRDVLPFPRTAGGF